MNIILDENGNVIDFWEERNNAIKNNLSFILQEFLEEKKEMAKSKKPQNLGYRFLQQLIVEFMAQPPLTPEQVSMIDAETLWDIWQHYYKLLAYYNRYFEIVDNKQIFMLYCGINDRIFQQWENSDDEYMRTKIAQINTSYLGNAWVAGESGNANPVTTTTRVKASGVGHNVVSASEDALIQAIPKKTPDELERELYTLIGKDTKRIN